MEGSKRDAQSDYRSLDLCSTMINLYKIFNIKKKINQNCLHICARRGYRELFEILLKLGANKDALD